MKEGAWLNAATNMYFWIDEHSLWIQDPKNAKMLGVSEQTWTKVKNIQTDFSGRGREEILLRVMHSGPFIRARGHGRTITFEFMCATSDALEAIGRFCQDNAGGENTLLLNNLRTKETTEMTVHDFGKALREDKRAVLRAAKQMPSGSLSPFADKFIRNLQLDQ